MSGELGKETRGAVPRTVGPLAALLAVCAALLIAPGVSAAAGGPSAASTSSSTPASGSTSSASPSAVVSLSNLKTLTRWAYPQSTAAARRSPSRRAPVVGYLHYLTSDGQAEVYVALRSETLGKSKWIQVEVPGRPNGRLGWVPASALGELHVTHDYVRVNRESLKVTLFRNGRPIWSAPVGVGRPSLPTPTGHFYITEKLEAVGGGVYGPFALGTSAYAPTLSEWPGGGVVGMHGTDEPQLVPGYPSHGCIRLHNQDITYLYHTIEVGTPLEIV